MTLRLSLASLFTTPCAFKSTALSFSLLLVACGGDSPDNPSAVAGSRTAVVTPSNMDSSDVSKTPGSNVGGTPDPDSGGGFTLSRVELEEVGPPVALKPTWLAGDTHVHTDHSADGSALRQGLDGRGPGNVSISDQIMAARTLSSLNWLPLTDHRTYVQHYDPLWSSNQLVLIPGEEANGSPHATVLGAVESVIQNGKTSEFSNRNAALQQSIWDSMSQNASYGLAHPDDGAVLSPDGTPNQNGHVVGLDRVEMWNRGSNAELELKYCENRWNNGYRFGVVGASDNHFKELWGLTPPGSPKTWALASGETERGILSALHRQNTFVALGNPGPLLHFQMDRDADGQYESLAGDEVFMARRPTLKFRVSVSSALGLTLNVYQAPGRSAGTPAFTSQVTQPEQTFEFTLPWNGASGETWYRAELRGYGEPSSLDTNAISGTDFQKLLSDARENPQQLRALTTPIFVSTAPVSPRASDGKKLLPDEDTSSDGAVQIVRNTGRFAGFSDIARTRRGLFTVWEDHSRSGTRIMGRAIMGNGAADRPIVLSGVSSAARFARVAARGDLVWVVWQDERTGQKPRNAGIYARFSRDGGSNWSAEIKVRQVLAARSELPALVLPPNSEIPMIAWQELFYGTVNGLLAPSDATGFDILVSRGTGDISKGTVSFASVTNLSAAGKSYMAQSPLDTRAARYFASVRPSLAISQETGEILLAYQDNRNDPDPLWTGATGTGDSHDNDVFQIRVHSFRNAQWSAATTLGSSDAENRHPSVGFRGDKAVVAWVMRGVDQAAGVNQQVLASERSCKNSAGIAIWCPAIRLGNTGTAGSGQFVRLGRDQKANLVAVWHDSRSADWRHKLGVVTMGTDGKWGDLRLVAAPGNNTWAAVSEGFVSFTSSRNAQRLQRDKTHEIFVLPLK